MIMEQTTLKDKLCENEKDIIEIKAVVNEYIRDQRRTIREIHSRVDEIFKMMPKQ